MADRALRINPDGSEEIVLAENLTEKDRKKEYRCIGRCTFGIHKGETCGTVLVPCFGIKYDNHFSAVNDNHKKGCEYSTKKKEITASFLGRSCADKTAEDILKHFMGKDKSGNGGKKTQKGTIHKKADDIQEPEEIDENTIVNRKPRLPKDVDEFYDVLSEFSSTDIFAGMSASEWVVDLRHIIECASDELYDGQIALVIMGKTKVPKELENYMAINNIFAAYNKENGKKLFFIMPKGNAIKNLVLFNSEVKDIAILAKWHKLDGHDDVFICDRAPSVKQITLKPDKDRE